MEYQMYMTQKIFDNVTLITGHGGENCYLVEGKERALLIDSLCGVGDLKGFVESLTSLPVTVAITHGHIDHVPGVFGFGECYIHPYDIPMMYGAHGTNKEGRLSFENSDGKCPSSIDDVIDPVSVKTFPIYDGDVFDLGDYEIETIEVPGHTFGTVVFLDRQHRVVYSGDACNLNTLMNLPGSTSIEQYRESLLHLKSFMGEFDHMWGGHGQMGMPSSGVDDGIELCEKILARSDDAVEVPAIGGGVGLLGYKRGDNYLPLGGQFCNIVYSTEKLHKKNDRPVIKGEPLVER